jgi:hypothetical protein
MQFSPQIGQAMQRGFAGSPSFRDQSMAQVLAPFAQPNWGVPQVAQQQRGGFVPTPGVPNTPQATPLPVAGLGRMGNQMYRGGNPMVQR